MMNFRLGLIPSLLVKTQPMANSRCARNIINIYNRILTDMRIYRSKFNGEEPYSHLWPAIIINYNFSSSTRVLFGIPDGSLDGPGAEEGPLEVYEALK